MADGCEDVFCGLAHADHAATASTPAASTAADFLTLCINEPFLFRRETIMLVARAAVANRAAARGTGTRLADRRGAQPYLLLPFRL